MTIRPVGERCCVTLLGGDMLRYRGRFALFSSILLASALLHLLVMSSSSLICPRPAMPLSPP